MELPLLQVLHWCCGEQEQLGNLAWMVGIFSRMAGKRHGMPGISHWDGWNLLLGWLESLTGMAGISYWDGWKTSLAWLESLTGMAGSSLVMDPKSLEPFAGLGSAQRRS